MPPKRKQISQAVDGDDDDTTIAPSAKKQKTDSSSSSTSITSSSSDKSDTTTGTTTSTQKNDEKKDDEKKIDKDDKTADDMKSDDKKIDKKDDKISKPPKKNKFVSGSDEEIVTSSSSEEEGDKSLPYCTYGANCYRKSTDHRQKFRHPKMKKDGKTKTKLFKQVSSTSLSSDDSKNKDKDKDNKDEKDKKSKDKDKDDKIVATPKVDPNTEAYKTILKSALSKFKISTDEKRMLRDFRRTHNISDQDHSRLVPQYGWSADEYEDGEKKDDDCDLKEEREVLAKDGFAIISLKKDKLATKEHDNVFSRVCAKFFQTMSKAQANYRITEVGVIVNSSLRKKFASRSQEYAQKGYTDMQWAFHGTTSDSIKIISQTGFLHPDDLHDKNKKGPKPKAKAKAPTVKLLDNGFFGKGIYFSFYSDYAMFYSEDRGSDQVLLSQVLMGKSFQCDGRMDGADCKKGYNSHYSPKGNEIVVFEPAQILPRYIITFSSNDAEEREQEG
eukprot:TRINITY_DN7246_c0_g1_i1.p1 TRINITY_DN7246_c0_g1~~TRINITY_DN7246_c0_g1_i1.p1  ORF type:complete len:527 (-),score=178.37 TRINITY_DN7246_c0_g1_i1:154-1650(-)